MSVMAKDLSKYQQGVVKRYYEHQETIRSERLSDLVAEIWLCEDEKKATKLWGKAQVALMKAGCNPTQAAKVVGDRDVEGLAALVKEIDAGEAGGGAKPAAGPGGPGKAYWGAKSVADGRTVEQARRERMAAGGYDSLEPDNLKRAMKAFRRKLKTIRRDDESRLGNRYISTGGGSGITAIVPPNDYPPSVWEELVRQGRLKKAGQGTFELA